MKFHYPILFLLSFLLLSCSDEKEYVPITGPDLQQILNLPDVPYNYNEELPPYFFQNDIGPLPSSVNGIDNTPRDNLITDNGATLGRVLFYDRNLSLNRTTACGSCHRSEKAFADSSPFSHGLYGQPTKRNSMTLVNTRFYQRGRFFYDERASSLENQVILPILDHTEMDLTEAEITQRIAEQPYYGALFVKAFGSSVITVERIEKALSQFIRSMVSHNSKYDTGRAQVANMRDPFPNFTAEENRGKDLFMKTFAEGGVNCYACHTTEAFVSPNIGPINNGLDATSTTDLGAYGFYTSNPGLTGAFKIPTLRNITLTGPYMHDARFATLMQVIDFYNSDVKNHANLSPLLKDSNGQPRQLNLSDSDKLALFRFLYTLTDQEIMSDPRWLDPFINQHL
ncbi:cytochrome-c peroxidase [Flavobacterium sp. MFBS3-15]|uniref:cytochrome-c peroxidase n=1 Tax=Flavobacterium sp. MFBS3-15 TaxID=2989816 RepID=UPI002235D1C9|nr:cytochrome-c peroxidase [Flavobacterium sp. MFBS3-15]MCW4470091.1 cytochrome-c peroxidase [Flavobacterium sp. MFBS3-15]